MLDGGVKKDLIPVTACLDPSVQSTYSHRVTLGGLYGRICFAQTPTQRLCVRELCTDVALFPIVRYDIQVG